MERNDIVRIVVHFREERKVFVFNLNDPKEIKPIIAQLFALQTPFKVLLNL